MTLTTHEQTYLISVHTRLETLHHWLNTRPLPDVTDDAPTWYAYLSGIKDILGNSSNDASFVACLLAKAYLVRKLDLKPFDVAIKPQGAPGLDIDAETVDGKRVVGEIKTTVPYAPDGLGSQQETSFFKDFAKLNAAEAAYKFFFVSNNQTFQYMRKKHAKRIPGVMIVLVPDEDEYMDAPL